MYKKIVHSLFEEKCHRVYTNEFADIIYLSRADNAKGAANLLTAPSKLFCCGTERIGLRLFLKLRVETRRFQLFGDANAGE